MGPPQGTGPQQARWGGLMPSGAETPTEISAPPWGWDSGPITHPGGRLCPQIKTGVKSHGLPWLASPALGTNAVLGCWGLGHVLFPPPRSQTQEWAEGRGLSWVRCHAAEQPRPCWPPGGGRRPPVRLRAWGHLRGTSKARGGCGPDILGPRPCLRRVGYTWYNPVAQASEKPRHPLNL